MANVISNQANFGLDSEGHQSNTVCASGELPLLQAIKKNLEEGNAA